MLNINLRGISYVVCVCFFKKSHLNKGAFSVRFVLLLSFAGAGAKLVSTFLKLSCPIPRVLKWFRRGNSLRNLQVTIRF